MFYCSYLEVCFSTFCNGHIYNGVLTLYNVHNINVEIADSDSTLFSVVDLNVDVNKVVSTLI